MKKEEALEGRPRVFIGSSTEGRGIAEEVLKYLREKDIVETRVWWTVFGLGDTGIETLFRELDNSDYAVLVATSDDKLSMRGDQITVPRDNVIFEAGLFMGRLGRKRSFVICDASIRLPSDLAGVTVAFFNKDDPESLESATKRVSDTIMSSATEREVDFLRAYLTFINPQVRLWHTYADILYDQYNTIWSEVQRLRTNGEWSRLLSVKERLREYFEYRGMYKQGIDFGKYYVEALLNLRKNYEAAWSQVKDVGYMHILNGSYDEGREAIECVIENQRNWVPEAGLESQAHLLFYAYRYLAISFHRDKAHGDLERARSYLSMAARQLAVFEKNAKQYRELKGRYLRNLANLELEDKENKESIDQAIQHYRESLELFKETTDAEHIGISHLALAKALITSLIIRWNVTTESPLWHLRKADGFFAKIGWVEGQARILEQYARYYIELARHEENVDSAKKYLDDASSALDNSGIMFEKIYSGRFSDRLTPLRDRLHQVAAGLADRSSW